MEHIKKQLLDRCIKQLNALGAKYAIIIDDEKFGDLEIVAAVLKPKRTRNANRWSEVAEKVKALISAMNVGDVLVLEPPADEPLASFQAYVSSQAGVILGKGGDYYITSQNKEKNCVELLRIQ